MDTSRAPVIGLLHPGEMGAVVGHCLVQRGYQVLWASQSRGPDTAARASAAGLTDIGTIAELAGAADVVLSICPPHAALDVATSIANAGTFRSLYVDANAVSPQTSERIANVITAADATYVDGGIIGPPPTSPGHTRLYLSGDEAGRAQELFAGTNVDARIVTAGPYSASSVKMAYAAWTKGSSALLLTALALAEAEGVADDLRAEWALSQPALETRAHGAANSAAKKGWRWVAEMEEIAATMASAGLPAGFHQAAAQVYRREPRR